jgi:hypothetical protein
MIHKLLKPCLTIKILRQSLKLQRVVRQAHPKLGFRNKTRDASADYTL